MTPDAALAVVVVDVAVADDDLAAVWQPLVAAPADVMPSPPLDFSVSPSTCTFSQLSSERVAPPARA